MKLELIMFIIKYANKFVDYFDSLAFKEIQKTWNESYRERMERKTNVKIVTRGEL